MFFVLELLCSGCVQCKGFSYWLGGVTLHVWSNPLYGNSGCWIVGSIYGWL